MSNTLLIDFKNKKNNMARELYVEKTVIIGKPIEKVFDFLKLMENQNEFSVWVMKDLNKKSTLQGTDGTVGYIISWRGNKKAGEGEKELMNIIDGKRIETEIRFVKPMRVTASVIMETEPLSDTQTKVYLINAGTMKYPMNIFIPIAEKRFPRDMDESLVTLKNIFEK